MRLKFFLICLVLTCAANAFCKDGQKMIIRGTIQNHSSLLPVAFAYINLLGTNLGTASYSNGNFYLSVDSTFASKTVRISCIGFYSTEVQLATMDNTVTFLEPASASVISPDEYFDQYNQSINARKIIADAVHNLKTNTYQHPFNVKYYSIITRTNSEGHATGFVESILTGYNPGYKKNGKRKFEIVQARRSGERPFNGLEAPAREIYADEIVDHHLKVGVFFKDKDGGITCTYDGATIYDKDTVYMVKYGFIAIISGDNPANLQQAIDDRFSGKVWISKTNHAIVKHEFSSAQSNYQILYKRFGSTYFPYFILGFRSTVSGGPGRIVNALFLLDLTTLNVQSIDANANETDFFKVPFDRNYWEDNFPVVGGK